MEREKAFLMHREVVQPFIKDAFKEGAHRTKPKTTLSKDLWARQIMIGVVYNDIGSTATMEELADKYGTFKQSISISNKSFLTNLWLKSPPWLKDRYPLSEILSARKPLKPQSQQSKEKKSLSRGGTSLRIKEQVERGITDIDKISENTGISKKVIRVLANSTLKGWGIVVPRKYTTYKEIIGQLDNETDDRKNQELLDRISVNVVHNDIQRRKEASRFSKLPPLIREAGFSCRDNHPFATSLTFAGVPVSIKDVFLKDGSRQTYYVVLSRHRERIIQVLKEDQSLQRFQR